MLICVTNKLNVSHTFNTKPSFHLQQAPRPQHKKQSDYWLNSHPSHLSLCFESENWSLSWSNLALWKPGFKHHPTTENNDSDKDVFLH